MSTKEEIVAAFGTQVKGDPASKLYFLISRGGMDLEILSTPESGLETFHQFWDLVTTTEKLVLPLFKAKPIEEIVK